MQLSDPAKAAMRLASKSLWRFSSRFASETTRPLAGLLFFVQLAYLSSCTPARDTAMRDVERNYTSTGFLDTDTFQVRCPIENAGDRLERCRKKMVADLVTFKEGYDRAIYARRNHPDFQPFLKYSEVSDETKAAWASFYEQLLPNNARLVSETRAMSSDLFEGVYRLRQKGLIYRIRDVH